MKKFLKRMLLSALLCVPWVTQAQTDTLTVADGTNTNYNIPFYGTLMDADQHNQVIYPASMTANIVGDSITGIGFYMSSTNSDAWGAPVTIRLGITSDAALTGIDNNTVLTQVWQGTINGQGDIWIQFDSAYAFQGGNLLLDVQTVGASWGGASFYGVSQSGASYCSYNGSVYAEDFIPKTSFLHVEGNFEVCLMPTNLSADIDSNQIVVSWDGADGVLGYNVYLNDSLVGQSVSDTFYVFSDLASNSLYYIAVTSVCADGESPAIGGSFRTDCGEMVIPFFANFDNDPNGVFPPCWTRILQSGSDPSVNSVWSHSGGQSMYLQGNYDYNMFASQAIPLEGNNIKVGFWAYLNENYEGWIKAGVMTDRNDTSTFIPMLYITDMNSEWTYYEFSTHDLDANATYYAAFLYYGTYPYNYGSSAIDDISITPTDGCAMPRFAAIDSVDSVFVTVSWVAGSTSSNYELAYGTSNDVNAANIISEITDTSYTVNGLNPGTMYYFWVRNICTNDDTTAWTSAGSARTACSDGVNAPYVENFAGYDYLEIPACWNVLLGSDNYGSAAPYINGDYLYFYPQFNTPNLIVMPYVRLAANAMNIELNGYRSSSYPVTFEVGYVTNPDSAESFVALGSIAATSATDYEFNTAAVEEDSIWIAFRASTTSQYGYAYLNWVRIGVLGNCVRPDYLAVDSVGHDMAVLHCNNTDADNYEVRYATVNNVNAADALSVVASDTTITLSSLAPSSHYFTWVRSVCGDDESSEWRVGPDFTTMCGEDYCQLIIDMHDSYGDGWNGNGINVYHNGSLLAVATIDNGNSNVASLSMCEGDTIELTWSSGSYASETSFEIYHAGMMVLNGGGSSYSGGDSLARLIGCPACLPVSNLWIVDSLTTDESLTVSWSPNSENDDGWIVTLDGQTVAMVSVPEYTFNGLLSRTGYEIGVATYCGEGDTSGFAFVNGSTLCEGNNCRMVIDMHDSYGDGWNGYGINVSLNGATYALATIASGNSGVMEMAMCDGDTVVLTGVSGSYPGEVSFEIYHAGGMMLQGVGGDLNGDTLIVLYGCPTCVSPSDVTVSGITTNSATLNWSSNGVADGWHLTINSASAMVLDTILSSVPFTIYGLQSATGYTVMVSGICNDDTANAATSTFVTACDDITLPWLFVASNDASSSTETMPMCWYAPQQYSTSYSSYPYNNSNYGAIYGYSYMGTPCMAVTPRIPTGGNNIFVRFHARTVNQNGTVRAGVMRDAYDASSFIPIMTFDADNMEEFEFTTDGIAGLLATDTVHIAFQASSASDGSYSYSYFYLYDVYVQEIPNCHRPDSIVVSNVTDNSATLSWPNSGAASYSVFVDDTVYAVNGTSINLTGLQGGTTYRVDVRGNCSEDSSLLQHVSFSTNCIALTLPWMESFEGTDNYAVPNCWSFRNQYPDYNGHLSPYVYDYDYYAHTGTKSLEIVGTSTNGTMAISPLLTGEAMNTLHVSFWVYGSSSYGFEAGFMTDVNDDSSFVSILNVPSTTYNSTEYSVMTNSLPNTDSAFHFAIRYTSSNSYSGNIYIDDISIMRMPECSESFASAVVTNVTGDGASLTWETGLGINANSSFSVAVMDGNFGSVSMINNATSPLTITGLNSNSEYKVAISLNCGGTVAATSDTLTFNTLCSTIDTFYSFVDSMNAIESSYAPMGYSYYNYGYTQTIIDSARIADLAGDLVGMAFLPATADQGELYNHINVYLANVSDNDLNGGWITPDANHVFVQVINDADMRYDTASWQHHVFSQRFTWDGHSNILVTIQRNHGSYQTGASFAAHSDTTTIGKTRYSYNDNNIYDINDPSAAGTLGGVADYVSDLMLLACTDACPAPTAYATVNDYQSATISWTTDADNVEYALKAASDADYPTETIVANSGSYVANGLTPATTYLFRVRALCEEGAVSQWAEVAFTTDSLPCFVPENLTVVETGYTTATLQWSATDNQTQWSIHVWNSANDYNYDATEHPFIVTGLAQNLTYYAAVKAICGNGAAESEYSDTITFTTGQCAQVAGVNVTGRTSRSAVVNWTSTGAPRYKVEYGDRGFPQGTGTTVFVENGQTSVTLENLAPDNNYSVFVMAICEEGVEGAWSERYDFATLEEQGIDVVNGNMNLSIYPNPTSDATTIALSGVNGEVQIVIVDMNGRTVMSDSMSCEGDCTKRMEVSGLAQGAYFVRVSGEGVNQVKKLVVK